MAAAQAQAYTVLDTMIACGVNNVILFNGASQVNRIATEVFDEDHTSVMDKTFTELQDDLKTYSQLTVANRQIRFTPSIIRNIKAYIQWGFDVIRVGEDPTIGGFNVNDARDILRKYKTHETFASKSKTITETSKPPQFTSTTKWDEWCPVFITFLRMIPGRNGQPLSYVCRCNDAPLTVPNVDLWMIMLTEHHYQEKHSSLMQLKSISTFKVSLVAMKRQRQKSYPMHLK